MTGSTTLKERRERAKQIARQQLAEQRKRRTETRRAQREENLFERELMRRELVRRNYLHFVQRYVKAYQAGWVHRLMCLKLERFLEDLHLGHQPRLMFFLPPRTGKSALVSNTFPAWVLGKYPWMEFIAASYGSSLPLKFSRNVRSLLRDKSFQVTFPDCKLDKDNENVEGWNTTQGGGYTPAGVGGGITGKGAHILSIDDPIKDAEEADSDVVKESIWDWYGSTAYTRLAPNSGVLVTQTRWADDDLAGRLLEQQETFEKELAREREMFEAQYEERRDQMVPEEFERWERRYRERMENMRAEFDSWDVVSFPAIAEEDEFLTPDLHIVHDDDGGENKLLRRKGEALHPERFPLERLKRIKSTTQPRHWAALYQQKPVPDEGVFFTKDMFRIEMPEPDWRGFTLAQTWDLAIGLKQQNDFTVGATGGLDSDGAVHVLKILRRRMSTGYIVSSILDEYEAFEKRPQLVGIEKGQLEMAIRPELERQAKKRRVYPPMAEGDYALKPVTDKLARARPLQGQMQLGNVWLPGWVDNLDDIKHELLRFPNGVHDDIVDALAWLVRLLAMLSPPKALRKKGHKSWRDKIKRIVVHGKDGTTKHPLAA